MLLDETQQFLDLSVRQWSFNLPQLPGEWYIRRLLLQELGGVDSMKRDCIVGSVKHLSSADHPRRSTLK